MQTIDIRIQEETISAKPTPYFGALQIATLVACDSPLQPMDGTFFKGILEIHKLIRGKS